MIEYANGGGGGGNPTFAHEARRQPGTFPGGAKPAPSGKAPRVNVTPMGVVPTPVSMGEGDWPGKAIGKRPRKPAAASKPAKAGKRGPPKGGLDLKALSKSWRAAGKPGRWIDWVKKGRR